MYLLGGTVIIAFPDSIKQAKQTRNDGISRPSEQKQTLMSGGDVDYPERTKAERKEGRKID